MKIGIMGGTFDPIHNGHLMLGEYAYREFKLDQVWFMPNGNPPHKQDNVFQTTREDRMEMVTRSIEKYDYFRLEDYEIKRQEISYSYQTMEYFKEKYPDIEFHYRECPDKQIERWFRAGEGNVALSLAPCDETLYDVLELESFPVKLLVNKDHPLARKSSVTIEDLKDEPLYIESREFKIHDLIINKCREAGFEPNIIFETSGFSLCHKMVRDNKGISVTVDFVSDDMSSSNLVLLPFSDGDYEWKICMLTRKNEVPGNGVDIFQRHIKQQMDLIRTGVIKR